MTTARNQWVLSLKNMRKEPPTQTTGANFLATSFKVSAAVLDQMRHSAYSISSQYRAAPPNPSRCRTRR